MDQYYVFDFFPTLNQSNAIHFLSFIFYLLLNDANIGSTLKALNKFVADKL